ncbi:MAG: hypothetical protein AAGC55_20545, partial [Myxococcota bacterium]
LEQLDDIGAALRIRMAPLASAEQDEMRRHLAQRGVSLHHIDDQLWQEAAGHPMLLAELAHYAQEAPGELLQAHSFDLKDVIWLRASGLSDKVRALMELVAIAGEPTSLRALGTAAELSTVERERAASVLRIVRLVRQVSKSEDEPWIDSYHDKVREAVSEHLSLGRSQDLHRKLAMALEEWEAAPAATLARHWLAAGERVHAVGYLLDAAAEAAEQLALEQAAALYREVLEQSADSGGDPRMEIARCRAWIGLAEGMRLAEKNDEALALLDRAEPLASKYGLVEEQAKLHVLRGNLLFPSGDWQGCLKQHEAAYTYAEQAKSLEWQCKALGGMGDAYSAGGRMTSAYTHMKRCVTLCREHGFQGIELANLPQLAWFRLYQNELQQAVQDCDDSLIGAARLGHGRSEMVAHNWLGVVLTEMARFDEARHHIQRAIDFTRAWSMDRLTRGILPFLCKAMLHGGAGDEAEEMLRQAQAESQPGDAVFSGPMRHAALALIIDDADERRQLLATGEELLAAGSVGHNYLFFYRDAMDIALAMRDGDACDRYANKLAEYMAVEPTPWSEYFVARGQAMAEYLRRPGDSAAVAELRRLRDDGADMGYRTAAHVIDEAFASDGEVA